MLELAQLFLTIAGIGVPIGLVLMMSGHVKTRNELDTLIRAFSTICLAATCYWVVGFGLLGTETLRAFTGFSGNDLNSSALHSGICDLRMNFMLIVPPLMALAALLERGRFGAGNILIIAVACLIVPFTAHMAWVTDDRFTWFLSGSLADQGGAVVVFASAGFVALATSVTIGPRKGRFPSHNWRSFGHSPSVQVVGQLLMIFGLASLSAALVDEIELIPVVFFRILLGTSVASATCLLISGASKSHNLAGDFLSASLAGTIALFAFAPETTNASAALTGVVASGAAVGLRRLFAIIEIDDPADLSAAFLAGGLIGGILVPLLHNTMSSNLINLVVLQLIEIAIISIWSFGITFLIAQLLHRTLGMRVSEADELQGLSRCHFGIQSEFELLSNQLQQRSRYSGDSGHSHEGRFADIAKTLTKSIVEMRAELHRGVERIRPGVADAKLASAQANRIRLAEDTLRVRTEDILMLLEGSMTGDDGKSRNSDFQDWLDRCIVVLLEPTFKDLDQFRRHLPLQIELEELENIAHAAADEIARSSHQIEILRDFANATIDGLFSSSHECDLAQLLCRDTRLLTNLAEVRNSPIQLDCPVTEGLTVAGDAAAFSRIFMLTLESALNRLNRQRGKPVRLELREHSSADYVIFECLDTGTALSSRQVKAILDPVSNEYNLEDIGLVQILPLMLVARLVEATGGELSLSSEQGLGTLMHCSFRKIAARKPLRNSKAA